MKEKEIPRDVFSPSISVVVPVYGGALSLPELARRLTGVLPALARAYEVILVNDGSEDDSWRIIQDLTRTHPWIRGINLMRNCGQHNALLCGIRSARHDVIVTLDDDLQNPPEEIGALLNKLNEGYDVVYGTPRREQHGILRDAASVITKLALQSAMGVSTARSVSAFRVFRSHLRLAFAEYRSPFVSIDVLLTWGTNRFASIAVRHDPRQAGKSNYTVGKLVRHAFNMMTGFSVLPLQLAIWVGFAFTLFGAAVLCFVLVRYALYGSVVQGFPFLAAIIALFSGAQLFAMGIFGEYLARIHFRLMDRLAYTVKETVGEIGEA